MTLKVYKKKPSVLQVKKALEVASTPQARRNISKYLENFPEYKDVVAAIKDNLDFTLHSNPWNRKPVMQDSNESSIFDKAMQALDNEKLAIEAYIAINNAVLQRAYKVDGEWIDNTNPVTTDCDDIVREYLKSYGYKCENNTILDNNGKPITNNDATSILNSDNFNRFMLTPNNDNTPIKMVATEARDTVSHAATV